MRFDHVFDLALDCLQSQLGEVTVQVWMGGYPGSLCAWYAVLLHSGYNERACRLLSQSLTTCQTLIKAVDAQSLVCRKTGKFPLPKSTRRLPRFPGP